MANKIIAYVDGAGTKYGATEEESLQVLLQDYCTAKAVTLTAPFNATFADLAALQAVAGWSAAIALPPGLTPRRLTLNLAEGSGTGIASVSCITGDPATAAAVEPTGATPFPTVPVTLTGMTAAIAGVSGEQRASN